MLAFLLAAAMGCLRTVPPDAAPQAPAGADYYRCEAPAVAETTAEAEPAPPPVTPGELQIALLDPAPDWSGWRAAEAAAPPEPTPTPAYSQEVLIGEDAVAALPVEPYVEPEPFAFDSASNQWFWERAGEIDVRLYADGIQARALAVALAEATGLSVVVDRAVAEQAVFLSIEQAPLSTALFRLRSFELLPIFDRGVLRIQPAVPAPPPRPIDVDPLMMLLVPLTELDAPPRALADALCADYVSGRGSVAVLGEYVLIEDHELRLGPIREAISACQWQPRGDGFICGGSAAPPDPPGSTDL